MIQILYYVLFFIGLLYCLYFTITGLFAFLPKKANKKNISKLENTKINKFAVLIAARNEELVIKNLINSLENQNYPKDKYEIIAIINNCTDNTEKAVKETSATALVCDRKVKTKGEVLKFAFEYLESRNDIDAYVVFDADNVVDKNFLQETNKCINNGYNVIQGYRDSKNMSDNWLSGSYTLFYYMQAIFLNLSRKKINSSAFINGTGFTVTKECLERVGFNPKTLTEDQEFTAICALKNEKIFFCETAITYDEHPIKFKDSWKQRSRWSKGMLQCSKLYNKRLVKKFFMTGNLSCLDMCLTFLSPIMQVYGAILSFILLLFRIFNIKLYDIFSYMFSYGLSLFLLFYIFGIIVSIFVLHYNKHTTKDNYSGILLFTFFIITWIPINIECMFKKDIVWSEIKHTRNIDIS